MPNWCENRLKVSGPQVTIQKIKDAIGLAARQFDCNGIVPMPESLKITKGSSTEWGKQVLYGDWQAFLSDSRFSEGIKAKYPNSSLESREQLVSLIETDKAELGNAGVFAHVSLDEARLAKSNLEQYGFEDWYDWSVANWGTKWNIGDVVVLSDESGSFLVQFDTAWSPPIGLIERLCQKYPDIEVEMHYGEVGCFFAGTVSGAEGLVSDVPAEDVAVFLSEHFGYEPEADEESEDDSQTAKV